MTNNIDNLILDLLEWLGPSPRPDSEVLDAWRTSCPPFLCGKMPTTEVLSSVIMWLDAAQFVTVSIAGAEHLVKYRCREHYPGPRHDRSPEGDDGVLLAASNRPFSSGSPT